MRVKLAHQTAGRLAQVAQDTTIGRGDHAVGAMEITGAAHADGGADAIGIALIGNVLYFGFQHVRTFATLIGTHQHDI